jgi:hypothetical protein
MIDEFERARQKEPRAGKRKRVGAIGGKSAKQKKEETLGTWRGTSEKSGEYGG